MSHLGGHWHVDEKVWVYVLIWAKRGGLDSTRVTTALGYLGAPTPEWSCNMMRQHLSAESTTWARQGYFDNHQHALYRLGMFSARNVQLNNAAHLLHGDTGK